MGDLPRLAAEVACDSTSSTSSGHPGDVAIDNVEDAPVGNEQSNVGPSGMCWERVFPHYGPKLLPQTSRTRQFEFHPSLPNVMLVGDKKGNVNALDITEPEAHPPLAVGTCPILGLAWMRRHPQLAVCGASHSGRINFLKYDPCASRSEPRLSQLRSVEEFPKLSSLSVNCTDDFLLASGISPNIAAYDIHTGKVMMRANGIHEHFINISRFCNTCPHVFATSSFDHTCKVWDLRCPILHDRPVKTLVTGGQNVMCTFSPDDRRVLCSGVDTRIFQFEVPSWRQTPDRFPLREPVHRERYRRSTYTASGRHFVTAATEESHMHLMSAEGKKLGAVDFRGVVKEYTGTLPPMGRNASKGPPIPLRSKHAALVRGAVQLNDADPNGGSSRNNHEFVQSVRTHPLLHNRVGVLLSLTQGEQSYVALVDLDCKGLSL